MADTIGEIEMDGNKYRIDVLSWKEKDMADFAPRATTAGGSMGMSDLLLYQVIWQQDFRHGFGWQWYTDAAGYLRTEGSLDTRHSNIVMLMTAASASDTGGGTKLGGTAFSGDYYTWGSGGIRKYNGTSWSSVYSTLAVRYALATKDYLFFCPENGRIQKMDTAGTITDAGQDSNANDFECLAIFEGYIWGAKHGTNQVHFSSTTDLSDMEGVTTDTDITYAGSGSFPILKFIVYAAHLYAARQDGLWVLSDDKKIWRCVLDYSTEPSVLNFSGAVSYNGMLFYSMRSQIYSWNSARYNNQTPQKLTDVFPYVTYGNFSNFMECDGYMYMTARTNETTYTESLLCFDGASYHKLCDIITTGSGLVTGLMIDPVHSYIFIHVSGVSETTYGLRLQPASEYPYSNFPTTGNHRLITSRMDGGFRQVKKSTPSLIVQASNVTTARYIKVEYSLDGAGWALWQNITVPGQTTLYWPGGLRTVEYNYLQLRFTFITDNATQSPIFEGYALRLLMRPDEFYGYNFNIYVARNLVSMDSVDSRDAYTIESDLKAIRASKSPVELVDLYGQKHYGYISSITFVGVENHASDGGAYPNVEMVANVNFVEAKSA